MIGVSLIKRKITSTLVLQRDVRAYIAQKDSALERT
jgi:hypothetical protein